MDKKIIQSVFLNTCTHYSERVAISESDSEISYFELNQKSNQLAWGLKDEGINAGDVVALAISPSIDYVIAMLAVLKAGAIFMPIDSGTPKKRLDYILTKIAPKLIVHSQASHLFSDINIPQKSISTLNSEHSAEPDNLVTGEDSAYIIFTSGSTGLPKAIEGQHKGLSHFIHWEIKEFALTDSCRSSWIAPPTFDVSLRDIFVPLITGGTLYIPSPDTRNNTQHLLAWLMQKQVNLVHCVPSLFRMFASELREDARLLTKLKLILLAGEPLYAKDILQFHAACSSPINLVNLYGPSETTLAKAFYRIPELTADTQGMIPIGQAISNAALLIIKQGRLCNKGEIGEIYIKTPFRTKGYYQDLDLSNEVFVQNPLNPDVEDIIYKTGDSGRYLDDHSVAFLGRLDNQVKINGVRIELAEIEQALLKHPNVEQCVVLVQKDSQQEQTLVCYFVAKEAINNTELRLHLGDWLPSYMLPQFFVALAEFPLNLHGKVDRKALPKPDALLYQQDDFVAPANEIEQQLAELWKAILGLEKVGVTHDFMEIGGDSLKAMRMVSGIYKALHIDVSLKDFFAQPTIRALAVLCAEANNDQVLSIQQVDEADSYPVSHAQKRLWLMDQMHFDSVAYNLPETLSIQGDLNLDALQSAFDALMQRHESLRTYFIDINGEPRQKVLPQHQVNMQYIDLSQQLNAETEAASYIDKDVHLAFDLSKAPLFRISVLKLREKQFLLVFNIHHIISDGWSLGVLTREWMQIYMAFIHKKSSPLPALAIQYKDYASWQHHYLTTEAAVQHKHYWLHKFSGDLPVLELDTDYSRPAMQSFKGDTLHFQLSEHSLQRFNDLLKEQAVSLFMGLTAVLKILLFRYSAQKDITIGTPVLGRTQQELEAQVGFYVNTLALRDILDSEQSFKRLLEQVKTTATEAFDHQLYPFDLLVEELDIPRDMSRSPLFDVMLVLQNIAAVSLPQSELSIRQFGQENDWDISRFDLLFHFNESAEGLELALNFNTDLFTKTRIQRLGEHFVKLVETVSDAPDLAITQLNILLEEELEQFTQLPSVSYPQLPTVSMSEQFDAQVSCTPDKLALIAGNDVLTYRQLQKKVDQLSRIISAALVSQAATQSVVAVYSERVNPIYLLACLKAGAIYLPIESHLPEQRVIYMLEMSDCQLIVHSNQVRVPSVIVDNYAVLCLDDEHLPEAELSVFPSYQDTAYLLFTSGSTGQPKGVMVGHQGFVAMALAQVNAFKLRPESKVLQFASIAFDASLSEVFMALFSGASLVLTEQATLSDTAKFVEYMNAQKITHITLPPVYLSALNKVSLPYLENLITAGEAAFVDDALHYAKTCRYFNAYGPTETSVCASVYQVDSERTYSSSIPIGKPLAHLQIFILDASQNIVPKGVSGEIYIAGVGVAKAYIGQAELSAQCFIRLPHLSDMPMYKTGDIGLWNEQGELEYKRRNDEQVKVSGYRIETQEIAQRLNEHTEIEQSLVLVQKDSREQQTLCAYYTLEKKCELWPSIAEFYVYDDVVYRSMFSDEKRNDRYRAAFAKVLSGQSVVEIGPGPELILSRLCLEAGARKIYAIELLQETYEKARKTLKRLGLEDKVTLIHGNAMDVSLPEKVDYCISEIVGGIGGSEGAAKIINSARRFLHKPENMLPMRSLTKIAAIQLPESAFDYHVSPIAAHYIERIFAQVGYPFDLRICLKNLPDSALISSADVLEDLDYTQDIPLETEHDIRLEFNSDGVFNGFLAWLNLYPDEDELIDILVYSDSWIPVYFPISLVGYKVQKGDVIDATVTRKICENGLNPDYFLHGQLRLRSGETIELQYQAYHEQQRFRANDFYQKLFAENANIAVRPNLSIHVLREFLEKTLPHYMVPQHFIELENFPVNSSGKVDRKALPQPFDTVDNEVDNSYVAAQTELEQILVTIWQDVLDQEPIGIHDHYFYRGGDSIRAIQMIARLREQGLKLEVRDIFQYPTIAELASVVSSSIKEIDQSTVLGEIPLTPIQHWFLQMDSKVKHHFNQAVLLSFTKPINKGYVQQVLDTLQQQHDALRMSYRLQGEVVQEITQDKQATQISEWDLSLVPDAEQKMEQYATHVQANLDLSGHLFQAAIFRLKEQDCLLLFCHHLVVDGVSWRILLEDFNLAYTQLLNNEPLVLAHKTDSFKTHAETLLAYAQQSDVLQQLPYWQKICAVNHGSGTNSIATLKQAKTIVFSLSVADTNELLGDSHKAFNTRIDDILLAALALSFYQWQGAERTLIELEGHGRHEHEGIDLQRTVGWFTNAYPHILACEQAQDFAQLIKLTKESLRNIPDYGLGYGILRYLTQAAGLNVKPAIGFNYLGQFSSESDYGLFTIDWQGLGQNISPEMPLVHQLDFLSLVADKTLQMQITFDEQCYSNAQIEQLSQLYQDNLRALCAFCLAREEAEITPADLTIQDMTLEELDDLFDD